MMREGRLRWFGHVKRRPQIASIRKVKALLVDGLRRRGRLKLRCEDRLKLDMIELHLSEGMTSYRIAWRISRGGVIFGVGRLYLVNENIRVRFSMLGILGAIVSMLDQCSIKGNADHMADAQNINNSTLGYEKRLSFVEQHMAPTPNPKTADQETIDKYYESVNVEQEVACLMLSKQAKQELFETVKAFHACKQEDGQLVSSYLLKMKSYLDTLERLGFPMHNKLGVCLILNYLNRDYEHFVQNYNMHSTRKMIAELHDMFKLHEKGIPKKVATPYVLAIKKGKIQKDKKKPQWAKGKDKGKTKLAYAHKPKIIPPPKRDNLAKDSICHHYKEVGHWMRNFPTYHAELKKRKNASGASTSGSYEEEEAGTWSFEPVRRQWDACNYGVFYFNAIQRDGSYEIDMQNLYPNVHSIYNVSNKRPKRVLDSTSLWHCHLGYINTKRIKKLQRDGILQPTDDESFDKCKSCISELYQEKVFQNDDENHLGKKIIVVRSYQGGEYLSHEFIDHMKIYGIVSQLTPPYTPQHNGVFERRNQTLLEMVRSMMNPTTLCKSFWGYALEYAAPILNMVPTKKVDKTPYEIWNGNAANLSYLKV
ncbi:zinc finger, CCHC-type containing protein [Tanacetum coccineum]|uniref:Zinc finger, CCHC-type containing protein n=1 Tax=Tanacetum coccineum TaxID=301880 RepID=A0ABQ5DT19_9ASTR